LQPALDFIIGPVASVNASLGFIVGGSQVFQVAPHVGAVYGMPAVANGATAAIRLWESSYMEGGLSSGSVDRRPGRVVVL
jgi:hypothetical protein